MIVIMIVITHDRSFMCVLLLFDVVVVGHINVPNDV